MLLAARNLKLCGSALMIVAGLALPAQAQRIIFPTMVPDATQVAPIAPLSPVYTTQVPQPPMGTAGGLPPSSVMPPASYGLPPASYAPPPTVAPFDPYAAPPPTASQTIAPLAEYPTGVVRSGLRLLQEIRIQEDYLARFSGVNNFGSNDIYSSASFAVPFCSNPAPILITPGFNTHFWSGPDSVPGEVRDLPARVYDAYLGASWAPQFTERLGADLAVSAGEYGDFRTINADSFRVLGRGVGIVTLSPQWQFAVGAWYIDRLSYKLLPAGGFIWRPDPDTRFDILFPNPKLAKRLRSLGGGDLWGYLAGEYGGGQWQITHSNGQGDVVNYNDIRILLGVEFLGLSRIRGNLEVGWVLDRSIIYRSGAPTDRPNDTILVRGGLSF
jgi:hypothetical protein